MPYKDNLIAREDDVFVNDVLCQIDQSKSTDNSYQTNVFCLRYLSGPCKAKLCHGEKKECKNISLIRDCVSTYLHDFLPIFDSNMPIIVRYIYSFTK